MEDAQGGPVRARTDELLAQATWVRRLARKLVRDGASAEDLVQETWLAALKRPPGDCGRLRPWLAHVLANFARQGQRADAHRTQREQAAARREPSPSASDTAERLEAQRLLVEALQSLDEPYRTTVMLRYFDGLSAAQIARRAGCPAGTVRWRLKHGLDELRARLDTRFDGGRRGWALAFVPLLKRPPLLELATGGASLVQGVMLMSAMTRAALVAAVVLTASAGVWLWSRRLEPDVTLAGVDEPRAPAALETHTPENVAGYELATLPEMVARETVAHGVEKLEVVAPAELSTKARIEARFLDASQHPVPGVHVFIRTKPGFPIEAGPMSIEAPTSDAEGRFAFELDLPRNYSGLVFTASAPGLATLFQSVRLEAGRTTYLGDLTLEPGGSVAGYVRANDGAPIAGAEVLVTEPDMREPVDVVPRTGPKTDPDVPRANSAKDGSFRVDGVPARLVRAWAGAEEMRWSFSAPIEVPALSLHAGVELKLEPLANDDVIEGLVRAPDGSPVPCARVSYSFQSTRMSSGSQISADEHGHFRIKVREKVPHELAAYDPQDRWPEIPAPATLPGAENLVLQFVEPHWIDLTVRIRGGGPLERYSASVHADRRDWTSFGRNVHGHPGGHARIAGSPQPFVVDVSSRGYSSLTLGPWDASSAPAEYSCELEPLPGIQGHVTASGKPVSGAKVDLHEMTRRGERIERNGFPSRLDPNVADTDTTGSDGSFHLFAREAKAHAILCTLDGYALSELSPIDVDPHRSIEGLVLELTSGGAIQGRVKLDARRDPTGTLVAVDRADTLARSQRVGSDGAFRFEHLTPGRWRVIDVPAEIRADQGTTTYSSGGEEAVDIPFDCVVEEGRTTHFDLDLAALVPCVLDGEVQVNGSPASGWMLTVWPERGASLGAPPGGATDASGRVRIEVRDPGKHTLNLRPPAELGGAGQFDVPIALQRGGNPWTIDLPVGALEGTCSAPANERNLFYRVGSSEDVVFYATFETDESGRFRLPMVLAGAGRLERRNPSAEDQWQAVAQRDVEVRARETVSVDIP